jgi:hypothetical protein
MILLLVGGPFAGKEVMLDTLARADRDEPLCIPSRMYATERIGHGGHWYSVLNYYKIDVEKQVAEYEVTQFEWRP